MFKEKYTSWNFSWVWKVCMSWSMICFPVLWNLLASKGSIYISILVWIMAGFLKWIQWSSLFPVFWFPPACPPLNGFRILALYVFQIKPNWDMCPKQQKVFSLQDQARTSPCSNLWSNVEQVFAYSLLLHSLLADVKRTKIPMESLKNQVSQCSRAKGTLKQKKTQKHGLYCNLKNW